MQCKVENQRNLAAMICWCIWNARNNLIWNGKFQQGVRLIQMAEESLTAWQIARREQSNNARDGVVNRVQKWRKPQVGWLKCNVDAAIFNQLGVIGLGCVIRDEYGSFVAAKSETRIGPLEPNLAEGMCCKEAFSWVKSLGYTKVIIELDAQQLIQALNNSVSDHSYYGVLVDDCKILSKDLSECLFVFAKRSANHVAHVLARAVGSTTDRGVWLYNPPSFIFEVMYLDNYE